MEVKKYTIKVVYKNRDHPGEVEVIAFSTDIHLLRQFAASHLKMDDLEFDRALQAMLQKGEMK